MADRSQRKEDPWSVVERINQAWLGGRTAELNELFHLDIAMALPGFEREMKGRDAVVGGFEDFVSNVDIHGFEVRDRHVHSVLNTAVVDFAYEMVYEWGGTKYRSVGRDLWVLAKVEEGWLAVWRTMFDQGEEALQDAE